MTSLPHMKLLAFLTAQPVAMRATWCDYWRGFWDGSRSIHKGPLLKHASDRAEYANGSVRGDMAYKAARIRRDTGKRDE